MFTVATTPVGDDGELAFLWGAYLPSEERHCVWWAHDRAEERVAFAAFVDFVSGQLRADGEAHLYCYTPQGASRLAAFAASLGVREAEVDDLLRQRRCVDLSDVVKKSVRVSQRSYALSALEPLYLGDDAQRWGGGESQPDGYAAYRRACRAGDSRQAQAVQEALAARCAASACRWRGCVTGWKNSGSTMGSWLDLHPPKRWGWTPASRSRLRPGGPQWRSGSGL